MDMDRNESYVRTSIIPGLIIVERPTSSDDRGFFREVERRGPDVDAVLQTTVEHRQWNHSRSVRGVLRGIHVARWTKCVYVVRGEAQAVIVDLRQDSPQFGKHESILIGDCRRAMIVVPPGCGNAFLVLSDAVDYVYSVDREWFSDGEYGVAWDDHDLGIAWMLTGPPFLSERDARLIPEKFPSP